jgi:transposase
LPLRPGLPERQTHDYVRHGTLSLFAAYDAATGRVLGHQRHRHQEFLTFLERIDDEFPDEGKSQLHLIIDNYATHKTPKVHRWLLRRPRFHLHFTPTGSSWLNMVERFFARITTEAIPRKSFSFVRQLHAAIDAYLAEHNKDPKPFTWTASADSIFRKLEDSLS